MCYLTTYSIFWLIKIMFEWPFEDLKIKCYKRIIVLMNVLDMHLNEFYNNLEGFTNIS